MNKTLLVGFLIAIATQSLGQGIVVQNPNPTTSIANRGSYIADSIFRIGTRDTVKPSWWNPAWSFNGALQIGLDGKPYYYYGGYWRGVGSGASVTSITQGYGMTLSPNPIVSTGSVRVDTTAISTKANVNSLLSAKLNISDTSSMLGSYLRKADTASLSNRINLKLNIADTNSMLGGYLRKVDTLTLSNRIDARVKYTDTSAMLGGYLRKVDTASLSNRINLKFNTADTANKWVNSVSKLNDSTIRVIKNTTTTDITISATSTATSATRLITAVYNKSGATIAKGSVVYIDGAHSSVLPSIALAKANAESTSAYTYGLVENDIPNNSQGVVIQVGVITNLNLPTSTYADGQTLYLSPTVAGGYTLVKPLAPNHYVSIGTITRAHPTLGTIQIAIRNGFQLDELSDVQIPLVPNDSDLLQFTRVDSLWKNVSVTTAIGNKYIKPSDTSAMLSSYLRKADTASLSTRINTKLNSADTASLSTRIDARVKYSDTSAMLGGYLRKVDTASLSNRINAAGNDWKLTGNAGTNASTNYVGTSDDVDVALRRNNVEKLRISNAQISTADKLIIGTNSFTGGTFGLATNNFVIGSDAVALGSNQWRTTAGSNMGESYLVGGVQVGSRTVVSNGRFENNAGGGYIFYEGGSERLRMISGTGVMFNNISADYSLTYKGTTNANLFRINAGTNNVGIGVASPNASAIFDVVSTTQGLGLPSMTTTQQDAIATPRTGLEIYNSTLLTPQFYNGSVWTGAWNKRGNSGTTAGTDFIGTTDNVDLVFKRSNVTSGWLNSALNNTSFGVNTLPITASGNGNTALGSNALSGVTTGIRNIGIGHLAGTNLSTSSNNIAIGYRTLGNAAAGHTGNENTTVGSNSMIFTTSALRNSGLGFQNLYNLTTGEQNTAIGWASMQSVTTSSRNTAVGSQSGGTTTDDNTFLGYGAGYAHAAGNGSVYIGSEAGFRSSGGDNVAIGRLAGGTIVNQVSGDSNVFIGSRAGSHFAMVGASKNVLIGYDARPANYTGRNQLNLGNVLWGADCSGTGQTAAGSLSIGANAPNASAIFDIVSTTKGLGLPSMTTAQQNAIGTPRAGLAVYNSTLNLPTFYNGTAWSPYFSGWSLTGNAGTSDATNFIGTTDGVDVIFRRNNVVSGRLNDAKQVTSFGVGALPTTSTGDGNTAFGWKALNVSTSGGANTALGFWSLRLCTTGFSNNAVGQLSLGSLTTGFNNCAFGEGSGQGITSGTSNTFYGNGSGNAMTTGADNIGIGLNAMSTSTAGGKNLVISASGATPSTTGSNQLNLGNVLWGVNCSGTGTTAAGSLSIGVNAPNASALLDLSSTTKGLLLPRMTTTEINAIASPAAGLTVYNTTLALICFYNGTAWQKVTATTM